MKDYAPSYVDIDLNKKFIENEVAKAPHLYKKTPHVTKMAKSVGTKALSFSPLLFVAWDYYTT